MGVLVIGIGNTWRGDDGVGPAVTRLLREGGLPQRVRVLELDGEGTTLLEAWKGAQTVVLIDAVVAGAAPGTIHQFAAHAQPLPAAHFGGSSHIFGVAEAVELGRVLGQLPPRLMIYGVEGQDFTPGAGLSPEVERAVAEVAALVRAALAAPAR